MTVYHRIIEDGIAWPVPLEDNCDGIEHEIADTLGIPATCVTVAGKPTSTGSLDRALHLTITIRTEPVEPSEAELERAIHAR